MDYLVFININTKYLRVFPLGMNKQRTSNFVTNRILYLIHEGFPIKSIRGDKDVVFTENLVRFL
jgi:hypothetical protein